MPRTLRAIKFVDLSASKLDDGGIADLKRQRGEIQYELSLIKKIHHTKRTEEQKAMVKKLESVFKEADARVKEAEQKHKHELTVGIKEGRLKFTKKVYVDYKGVRAPRPRHYLKWCRYEPANNFREFRDWQAAKGYSPVISGQDPYWPEGLSPDNKGYFVFGDLIMVKIPMKDYLLQRWEDIQRSNHAPTQAIERFKADVERDGGDVPEEIIQKIMGEFDKKYKRGDPLVPL